MQPTLPIRDPLYMRVLSGMSAAGHLFDVKHEAAGMVSSWFKPFGDL